MIWFAFAYAAVDAAGEYDLPTGLRRALKSAVVLLWLLFAALILAGVIR